jgi:signal transduction histidine kinase
MSRLDPSGDADEIISRLASAVSLEDAPEAAVRVFNSSLRAALPGLRVWAVRREAGVARVPAVWIPSEDPPPFPAETFAQAGSLSVGAIRRSTIDRFPEPGAADDSREHAPEASYLRRRGGAWIFLPVPASNPVGAFILNHADGEVLEASLETIRRATRLVQSHLGVLFARREVEKRIEERTAELALFYETSRALAFTKSESEIATILGAILGPVLGLEMLGLLVTKPGRCDQLIEVIGETCVPALRSFRREVARQATALLHAPLLPRRVRINRPVRLREGRGEGGGCLHVPLIVHDSQLGLLSMKAATQEVDEFKARIFFTVASQAALTLERMRETEEASLLTVRAVLNCMREGVVLVSRDMSVLMSNPAAELLWPALVGAELPARLRRIGDLDLAPVIESLAAGESAPPPAEIFIPEMDRAFHLTISPAMGLRGVFEGAILVLSDVTEEKKIQQQLMQSEKLSSLGEMISGVAHELNNPLASIMGYAQLMEQGSYDETTLKKVSAISREADRCHRIVKNLLRFARKQEPERRPVDINSVVGSVVQLLGYQLQSDNIALDVELTAEMQAVIGDFHALQQVFVNLVTNAHQAMKGEGGRGVLRISTSCDGLNCRVEVSDTGPGIPQQNLKKVFDPFFTTKEVGKGTGLGLSLAYSTMKEHRGRISARSRVPGGTTFVVELPVASVATDVPAADDAVAPIGVLSAVGRRILVVEDEASLSEMISEALAAEGYMVDRAADGLAAREMLGNGSYDLIISDLKMPRMGGRELYDAVHRMDPDLARRIIFSTGDGVSSDTQDFFSRTGNAFLTKPFNLRDLFSAVNSALSGM